MECVICLEEFSDAIVPVLLRCGHTFCRSCCIALKNKYQKIQCANCMQVTQAQPKNLPVNYIVYQYIELLAKLQANQSMQTRRYVDYQSKGTQTLVQNQQEIEMKIIQQKQPQKAPIPAQKQQPVQKQQPAQKQLKQKTLQYLQKFGIQVNLAQAQTSENSVYSQVNAILQIRGELFYHDFGYISLQQIGHILLTNIENCLWQDHNTVQNLQKQFPLQMTQSQNYLGTTYNGQYHGFGRLELKNFDNYEGNFQFGKFHGFGKYYHNNNNVIYAGFFDSGIQCGPGIQITPDYTYQGQFQNGQIIGMGVMFERNQVLIGRFEYGLQKNRGVQITPQYKFIGDIYNGQKHGVGVEIYNNKRIFEGRFSKNKRSGFGCETEPNGRWSIINYKGQKPVIVEKNQNKTQQIKLYKCPTTYTQAAFHSPQFSHQRPIQFTPILQ